MLTRLPALFCILFVAGCTPVRVLTLRANYPDAIIRVDDQEVGRGPIDHRFLFPTPGIIYRVSAVLPGYKEAIDTVTLNTDRTEVVLYLKRDTRWINVQVEPAPAEIRLDGQLISDGRVSSLAREIELGLDERNVPVTRELTAERDNFVTARRTISAFDRDPTYLLSLEQMRKPVTITTTPPGAEVYLDEQLVGTSPHTIGELSFAVNLETDQFIPRQIRAVKRGYEPAEGRIDWDGGRTEYSLALGVMKKEVRLFVDPPGATITIDGQTVQNDSLGVTVRTLEFPPVNEQGELRTYRVEVSKSNELTQWEPRTFTLGWEEGRTDYHVALKEILTVPVSLVGATVQRGPWGWEMAAQTLSTLGMKESAEPVGRPQARRLTNLAKGTQVDTLALAPGGSKIVFTVLAVEDSVLRSQMFLLNADGSGAAQDLTDGRSLDLMPSFTPDGQQVVYSSNRLGGRMQVWSMPVTGDGRITRLTNDNAHGLWPVMDSDPRPRLFRQAIVEGRSDPRLQVGAAGTASAVDLTEPGGTQPRVSPKNDSVIFCRLNERTGKRDLFRVSDKGGEAVNLTNTPDIDEYDPSWSRDGARIVFSADRAPDAEGRRNYDIWMIDLSAPDKPVQLTANGSVDDCPVFDVMGTSVYFRSNRGGEWGIWKIAIR